MSMGPAVTGVRCVELDVRDLPRALEFYTQVWKLTDVGDNGLRGSGPAAHLLKLRHAQDRACVRRVTFDARDREQVERLHRNVAPVAVRCGAPAMLGEGAGYGFDFTDSENRRMRVVCDVRDHASRLDDADAPQKIAHVNFNTADIDATLAIFCKGLGLSVIDESGPLVFLHGDNTDHNCVVIAKNGKTTLNHIAFEMRNIDAVMRGAGRMKEAGYPVEWGPGRHGPGANVFCYFAGWEEAPLEYTCDIEQVDAAYVPHGPDYWKFPPGRADRWGFTDPHSPRWKRIQDLYTFASDAG
ncbi:MAG: ring-cleavage extradiol dioxygenase [Hyphomicrobiales bacterium]|nr:ring-cleavage extradiol dioxygenase [Hyphomicrobiales bacterium]